MGVCITKKEVHMSDMPFFDDYEHDTQEHDFEISEWDSISIPNWMKKEKQDEFAASEDKLFIVAALSDIKNHVLNPSLLYGRGIYSVHSAIDARCQRIIHQLIPVWINRPLYMLNSAFRHNFTDMSFDEMMYVMLSQPVVTAGTIEMTSKKDYDQSNTLQPNMSTIYTFLDGDRVTAIKLYPDYNFFSDAISAATALKVNFGFLTSMISYQKGIKNGKTK